MMKGRVTRMAEIDEETIKGPSSNQLAVDRTNLAHERTLMSWIRTAMSLITFGFTIYKFFQLELQGRPPLQGAIGPRQFAILMISIGLLSLMAATIEYRIHRNDLRRRYAETPPLSLVGVVAASVSLLGLLALAAVLFRL
jgi:putative membrane protein